MVNNIRFLKYWFTEFIAFLAYPNGKLGPLAILRCIFDSAQLLHLAASFFGVRAPLVYRRIKNSGAKSVVENGINFAHGGSGVFQTLYDLPNMTTQIDFLQQLIEKNVFATHDLSSSIALVSLAGNDYGAYLARNGAFQVLKLFNKLHFPFF